MTILLSDTAPAASESTSFQSLPTNGSFFASDAASSISTTPSPFELLFSRQLGQSPVANSIAPDEATVSVNFRGDNQTENSLNSPAPKTKTESDDDGIGFTPLVNPLTMSLFTVPLPMIFEVLTTSTTATAAPPETGGPTSDSPESVVESAESQASDSARSALETDDRSIDDEEPAPENSFYSHIAAHQSIDLSSRIILPQQTTSEQATTTTVQIENRGCGESVTSDSSTVESRLTVASRISMVGSSHGLNAVDFDPERFPVKITSMTSGDTVPHLTKPSDHSTTTNPLMVPWTSFGGVGNVESSSVLTEQLAATIQEHLEDDTETDSASIRMQLDHPELGLIDLHLFIVNQAVSIQITAKNPRSRRMIESQMDDLRQTLTNSGVTCGPFQVESDPIGEQFSEPEKSAPPRIAPRSLVSTRWARGQSASTPAAPSKDELNVVA